MRAGDEESRLLQTTPTTNSGCDSAIVIAPVGKENVETLVEAVQ